MKNILFLALAVVLAITADLLMPGSGTSVFMLGAAVTTLTVGSAAADNNTFASKGRKSKTQIYEATSIPLFAKGAAVQYFCYAQLTGAMTINAATTLANLSQFDEIVFFFDADATERIVTFGTGFLSSGTVTIPISKGATVRGVFDGAAIRITGREIYA